MKRVLVAGASGYLGGYVLEEFKKQGYWIRSLTRSADKLEKSRKFIDEEFVGEVTNPESLIGVCNNIDIVFSSVGITKQKDNLTYMDVDFQGNVNILEEAKKEKVPHYIFISALHAEKLKHLKVIQAKEKFREKLEQSGLSYSIIYPNGYFSDMLEYLRMAKKGKGYVFADGSFKVNPIHGSDLAELCVTSAMSDNKEIRVGGPDIHTHAEVLKMAFDIVGRKEKITRIPLWVRDFILRLLRTFTSEKTYGTMEFFLSVLAMDMVAPTYGKHHLKDFFLKNKYL
jgi:uncharacterized protein YbjT (DUF2867 family)